MDRQLNRHHLGINQLMATRCHFNRCENPPLIGSYKCEFHKNREKCRGSEDCRNQVYARGYCVRHGGKEKCTFENCHGNARVGAFCSRHGGNPRKKYCIILNCNRIAHANQKCVAHGGGYLCKEKNCQTHARRGGYCQRHGREMKDNIQSVGFTLQRYQWNDDVSCQRTTTVDVEPINLNQTETLSDVDELTLSTMLMDDDEPR